MAFPSAAVSSVSLGLIANVGEPQMKKVASCVTTISQDVAKMAARTGIIPATSAIKITAAGGTKTLRTSSGSIRTINTVAIATGMTIAIGATGVVEGQRFVIAKVGTGGTGAVTVDGHAFTTHKKFNCELVYVNAAWRMVGYYEYA